MITSYRIIRITIAIFLLFPQDPLSAIDIDSSLKQDSPTLQEGNKVYISNEDAGASARYAASSPNADPLVAVPTGPPFAREAWRKKFLEDYAAAGGKGTPTFTVLRTPETPTLNGLPAPNASTVADNPDPAPTAGSSAGPRIDPALRQDSPTVHDGKVFVSNEDASAAARFAATSPNADPIVGVPTGPPFAREEWRKKFLEDYKAAGGKGTPTFGVMRTPETPTNRGPDSSATTETQTRPPADAGVDTKPQTPPVDPHAPTKPVETPAADPHTHGPAQPRASGSEHSENFSNTMGALGKGLDGLDKAGQVAAGVQKERETAARDGVDFSGRNAAENVVGTALGADGYNAGKKNAQEAIEKAAREGRSRGSAAVDALWKTAKDMSGITMAQEVFTEESEKEKKKAAEEGREASSAAAAGNTAVRVAGEKSGLNPVLDASMYDAEADRQAGDAGRRAQEKLKTELEEHLRNTGQLEQRMKRLKEREDMSNPSNRQWVRDLQAQYAEARRQAQEINNRTRGKMLDEKDPQLIAIRQAVDLLPENPAGVDMNEKAPLTPDEQMAAHDCSQHPHTRVGWNEAMDVPGCFCVDGYKFNKGETECLPDMAAQIKNMDCSAVAGSHALWNDGKGEAYCGCLQGYQMNGAQTACEPTPETVQKNAPSVNCTMYRNTQQHWFPDEKMYKCVCLPGYEWDKTGYACQQPIQIQLAQANCSHVQGTTPYWDEGANAPMCGCQPGYVIEGNACVPTPQQQPQPQAPPPDFSGILSGLTNTYNQGTGNNPPPPSGTWGASGGTPVPTQLPGLGPSDSSNSGGTYAGFTGWGQPAAANPPAYGPSSGGVDTSPGGGVACVTALGQSDQC